MSYGVALRNGVPFTLGTIAALCVNTGSQAWSPAALWPNGEAGLWLDPSALTTMWQDSAGTTPVVTPGTVADSANPDGLILDRHLGAPDSTKYATHTGTVGSIFSTPDAAVLQVTGDLDLRWHGLLRLWNTGAKQTLVAKREGAANNFGYELAVVGGFLTFNAGITSTTQGDVLSTAQVSFANSSPGWVRATRTASTGDIRFYTSTDGVAWTQLGLTVPRVAGASYASTGILSVGAFNQSGDEPILGGYTYQAQVLNGIDGTVVSNFTAAPYVSGATFVATTGETWTISGGCFIKSLGTHLSQATSTARPLVSARVNTLTYTEDFSNAVWVTDTFGTGTLTKTLNQADPNGGTSAVRLVYANCTDEGNYASFRYNDGLAAETVNRSWWIKSNTGLGYAVHLNDTVITLTADTNWHRYDVVESAFSWGTRISYVGGNADITVAFPQRSLGTELLPYQSVPGNGSTYTATGYPIYLDCDGTDDGLASASFSAGTLTSDMDCLIAVRRDAAGNAVAGLYNGVSDATKVFGIAESGSSSGCVGSGAGTPTVWVDGVQLTGGTSVTRDTLNTALTVGDWHILELRGLDLSTWTAAGMFEYISYALNGAFGGALLFPGGNTAGRDKAREWLANKVGVTL